MDAALAALLPDDLPATPLELHERLLTEAGSRSDDPDLATRCLIEASQAALEGGEVAAAVVAAERAVALAERAAPTVASLARITLAPPLMLSGRGDEAGPLLEAWLSAPESDEVFEGALRAAGVLFWLERYAPASDLLERLVRGARDAGRLDRLARPLDTLASVDFRLGHWTRAESRSREALRVARLGDNAFDVGSALTTQARILAGRGEEPGCRRLLEAARAASPDDALVAGYAITAEALLELSLDRPDATIALLESLAEIPLARHEPTVFLWEADLIEAYVRVGRRDDAERLLADFERRAASTGRIWARAAAARSRGLTAAADEIDQHFGAALELHERVDMPFERARTQLSYGARLRRSKRAAEARDHLRSALAVFQLLLAAPWAERTRRELVRRSTKKHARSDIEDRLTPHELQVAMLIGRGATNREAAAALFVSPKTIEYHLASIYRKLDVRSRTELALALGAPRRPTP
jgi:DNA-binding CsgD family transcriptional regulator